MSLSVRDRKFRLGRSKRNDADPTPCYVLEHLEPAHSTKTAVRWVQLGMLGGAILLASESPGCGGIVRMGGGDRDGGVGGYGGTSVSPGDPGVPPPPAQAGGAPGRRCGNGQIDPGEACDGPFLGGSTCGTATMGTSLVGVLRCSSSCALDTSACRSPNFGSGGAVGAGGFNGAGGRSADNACYDSNGVPSASGGCAYGYVADQLCVGQTGNGGPAGSCSQACGCKVCPGSYTRCLLDGGCSWILSCIQQYACANIADCYKLGCSAMIDRAGGLGSVGARYADTALRCLAQSGCSCGVGTGGG
jgi:hypothetical protein